MSARVESRSPKPVVDRQVVLFVTSTSNFLSSVMISAVNVALPTIGREFAVDAVTLSWVATVFLLAVAVFMVPAGKLADIHGRRRVFLYGVLGWTASSLLCGLAWSAPALIAFRALQGIAGAAYFGTSTAILTSVYPPQERGRALGINVAAVYAGLSVGPTAGGLLTQQVGWRSMFLLNFALGLLIVYLVASRIRIEWAEARGERLDVVGSVVFGITLVAVMYGFTMLPSSVGLVLVAFGLACLVAFVLWESRVPNPVLNIDLFRHNTVFALSNLAAFANYSATAGVGFLLSLYLQYVRGLDPQTAGFVLLAQPIVMVIFSPIAGRLSDRIEPRIVASTGMAMNIVALALLVLLDDASSVAYVVAALLVNGFGFGLFSSPNTNAVMSSVERRYLGIASATVGVTRSVGQMLSLGIATLIIALYVGGVQITPDHHASFSSAFRLAVTVFAALCVVGFFASLSRGNVRSPR